MISRISVVSESAPPVLDFYTLTLDTIDGTYQGNGLRIDLAGVLVGYATQDGPHTFGVETGLVLGVDQLVFDCESLNNFTGYVDNVRLISGQPPLTCDTIVYGSHLDTDIGNINTGSVVSPVLSADAVLSTADAKFGAGSVHVPIGNDSSYLNIEADPVVGTTQTIETFFKITEESLSAQFNGIIGGFGNNIVVYADLINDGGRLEARIGSDAYASTVNIALDTWYHLAVTFNSAANTQVYLDGVNVITAPSVLISGSNIAILGSGGSAFGAGELGGYIDEPLLLNYTKYTENFTPPTAPFETTC